MKLVFKLTTKREPKGTSEKTGVYGKARLWHPSDGEMDENIVSLAKRIDDNDETWEQRVVADVINHLESRGRPFRCLTDATPHPNIFDERTYLIVVS